MASLEARQIGLDTFREQQSAAEKLLDTKRQDLSLAQQIAQQEKARLQSTEERLAQLDPMQAQALRSAYGKANEGGALSFEEANRLRGLGLQDESVRDADRRRLTTLGLDPVLQQSRDSARAAEAREQRLNVNVNTQAEVLLKISGAEEDFLKEIEERLKTAARTIVENTRAADENMKREVIRSVQQMVRGQGRIS